VHCRCHKMVSSDGTGRSSVTQGVAGLPHEGEGCTVRSVEEFRASDEQGGCCQMPQRWEGSRGRQARLKSRNTCWEEGLCSLGIPLEVWIRNDALTFNTAHHAAPLFLLRDAIGNQATVRASVGWAFSGSLRCLSCLFEVHGAPPCCT
jgi:hypothetical protein